MSGIEVHARLAVPGFAIDTEFRIGDELGVLFGYSGSGKSLTLRAIAGLLSPERGTITIGGDVVFDSASRTDVPPQSRGIGYVAQEPALFPHLSVRRNIEYGLSRIPRDERRQRSAEMLDAMGLSGFAERRIHTLSGGQKQRVALARALAPRPRALLLDEPFSAIDGPVRAEIRELVRDVRRDFCVPVILVTHDLYEAYTLADRMVVYGGGAVQSGAPCELFKAPATPEIEALLSSERLFMCG